MNRPLPPFVHPLPHGIRQIDTGFHRDDFDAAYLIVEDGRAAFVDTGTNHALPRLLAALEAEGLPRDAVDYVIPTHVHLDHAGGAGALMRELPRATLVVHPKGAPHLIDPRMLMDSARGVYGAEEVARSYGELVPVEAQRVLRSEDGMTLTLAGRPLKLIETPGHARHHHCVWDERSRGFFTGDTFGLSYREFDVPGRGAWLMPTTTPVQFDPPALRASVERMLAHEPAQMYLTHYGRVGDVPRLGALMLSQLDAMVALATSPEIARERGAARHGALMRGFLAIHLASLREHGCTLTDERIAELLALDLDLNAQGIGVWLDRKAREEAKA
jgi:glyoxylase-like metal-dependent hydrolase (beta-lactamase superfamily II)